MNPKFKSTSEDIFNKLDMLNKGILGYNEFQAFCDCVEYSMNETIFYSEILENFSSTKHITTTKGLSDTGLTL